MNDFYAGYSEMLEEFLEPYDPQKFGRYHTLLDEMVYPIDYDILNYMAFVQYERTKYEKTRKDAKGTYHWWIHFNDFPLYDPNNMREWGVPVA